MAVIITTINTLIPTMRKVGEVRRRINELELEEIAYKNNLSNLQEAEHQNRNKLSQIELEQTPRKGIINLIKSY